MTFSGIVRLDGRLDSELRIQISDWLQRFAGKRVSIVVKKYTSDRSTAQNRYYWGVVIKLLGEHCGYDPEDMHQALAMKFLRIEDCPITGAPRRKSTPKCDTHEFAVYLDQCIRLAAELGVVIPDAREAA